MASQQVTSSQILKGKKGVCFTMREEGQSGSWVENVPKLLALHPHWYYSWGDTPAPRDMIPSSSVDFLPMIWGWYPKHFSQRATKLLQEQSSKFLLGFNEPDANDQSNISVHTAIEAWPQLEALRVPLLVSPACAQANGAWIQEFMKRANEKEYRVDIMGVHHYGGDGPKAFQSKLEAIYKTHGRPILITEFAVADWEAKSPDENKYQPGQVLNFMQVMLPWLEEQEWILGYSWFSFEVNSPAGCCSALFDAEGQLTDLGKFYAEFRQQDKEISIHPEPECITTKSRV